FPVLADLPEAVLPGGCCGSGDRVLGSVVPCMFSFHKKFCQKYGISAYSSRIFGTRCRICSWFLASRNGHSVSQILFRPYSACVMSGLEDPSFCVMFCCTLAFMVAWMVSYSGSNASYSAFTSGFCNIFAL